MSPNLDARTLGRSVLVPTAALVVASATAAQTDALDRIADRSLEYLWTLHEERGFPGGCAALVLPDGTELSFPVGFADVEAEREMADGDRMLSGSVGKTYVAAAAHKLMVDGKLDFERRVVDYLGDAEWLARVPNGGEVTLRQLLRHQSGIPRYVFGTSFFDDWAAAPDKVWKPEELLAYVFDAEPLFPPGNGWAYSDTNYVLVGMVIERVTGGAFYDYVEESLLRPLGLRDTVPSDSRRIPGLAQGYIVALRQGGLPEHTLDDGVFCNNPQFEWCGGGYASTALDLARWARLLYRGDAMEGDYLATMLDGVPCSLAPGMLYGCGVMITKSELGPHYGHDGIMTGYLATMGYYPEHDLSVVFMMNTDNEAVLRTRMTTVAEQLAKIAVQELER